MKQSLHNDPGGISEAAVKLGSWWSSNESLVPVCCSDDVINVATREEHFRSSCLRKHSVVEVQWSATTKVQYYYVESQYHRIQSLATHVQPYKNTEDHGNILPDVPCSHYLGQNGDNVILRCTQFCRPSSYNNNTINLWIGILAYRSHRTMFMNQRLWVEDTLYMASGHQRNKKKARFDYIHFQ